MKITELFIRIGLSLLASFFMFLLCYFTFAGFTSGHEFLFSIAGQDIGLRLLSALCIGGTFICTFIILQDKTFRL